MTVTAFEPRFLKDNARHCSYQILIKPDNIVTEYASTIGKNTEIIRCKMENYSSEATSALSCTQFKQDSTSNANARKIEKLNKCQIMCL